MHLVYKALEKYAIPNSLPPELLPPDKRKDSIPAVAPQPQQPPQPVAYTVIRFSLLELAIILHDISCSKI